MTKIIQHMLPAASVEVIATVTTDGSLVTLPVALIDSSSGISSLVDGCEDSSSEKQNNHGKPVLVPIESQSDSEDSSYCGDGNKNGARNKDIPSMHKPYIPGAQVTPTNTNSVTTAEDGVVGMYDCLSDHIVNFFCPVEQPANFCVQPRASNTTGSRLTPENHQLATTCGDAGCTEYQLQDFFTTKPGADVFTSLQFWLTPSQERDLNGVMRRKPHNRSSLGRKRRSRHNQLLWDSWHAETIIPLERSKSLPSTFRNSLSPSMEDEQADVCYDSDEEQEYRQKTQRAEVLVATKHQGFRSCRPAPISVVNEDEFYYLGTAPVPTAPRNSTRKSSDSFNFYSRRSDSLSKAGCNRVGSNIPVVPTEHELLLPEGEYILRTFIQEATNSKIPLVWHRRTRCNDTVKTKAPMAVTCAFEVGAHLDNLVVQPKFTWRPAFEPHLPKRKIRLSGTEPDSIELLSIIRVVKPTELNRELYPFARLDQTCCITTNDEEFPYLVFEAHSTRERDWLVNALKIVVARLASIIIVRDEAMLLEFFTPYAALMHMDTPAMCAARTCDQDNDLPSLETNGELQLLTYAH